SRLATETEKEKPLQKLKEALGSIPNDEPNPSDPEKLESEKLIIRLEKKIKKFMENERRGEKPSETEKLEIFYENALLREMKVKNIDKITDSEMKNELLKIVDTEQKTNLGKYHKERKREGETEQVEKTIDLSQFTLVATTSTAHPQLSSELKNKLYHKEPFLE